MHKLVGPDWNRKLVTEITKADVEKLLNKIAAGRARPSKAKPNNRARKLKEPKPTPVRANRVGEVLRMMFSLAIPTGLSFGQLGKRVPPMNRTCPRVMSLARGVEHAEKA
jgi:hypothetical protein